MPVRVELIRVAGTVGEGFASAVAVRPFAAVASETWNRFRGTSDDPSLVNDQGSQMNSSNGNEWGVSVGR